MACPSYRGSSGLYLVHGSWGRGGCQAQETQRLSGGAARSVGELCSKSSMPSLEIGGVTHHAELPAQTRGFPHPSFLTGVRLFAMNKVTPAPFDQLLESHIVLLCPSLYPLFLCPTFCDYELGLPSSQDFRWCSHRLTFG